MKFCCEVCGTPDKGKDIYINSFLFAIIYKSNDSQYTWAETQFCYDCQSAINQAIFDRRKLPKTP